MAIFRNATATEKKQSCSPVHCAQEVLKQVHSKTSIGNKRLERLSIVMDGGIGLRGALCGALAGAILSLNLVHGFNLRQMSYGTVIKKFLIGHINLIRKKPGRHRDTFSIGKQLVNRFREQAGSIECRSSPADNFTIWMTSTGIWRIPTPVKIGFMLPLSSLRKPFNKPRYRTNPSNPDPQLSFPEHFSFLNSHDFNSSNRFFSIFFLEQYRTKIRPFIATYTPGVRICTAVIRTPDIEYGITVPEFRRIHGAG